MMKYKYRRMTAVLVCVLILVMSMPQLASAAGKIELNKDVSLTISYHDDTSGKSVPITAARFAMYRIATVDEYGEFTLTDEFTKYRVDYKLDFDITGKNDEAWRTLAETLEGYVSRDALLGKLPVAAEGKTDAGGMLTLRPTAFAAEGSQVKSAAGLYLVLGDRCSQNGYYYDASPFIVMLPSLDMQTNTWRYDAAAEPKHESRSIPSPSHTLTRKALKMWNDSENPQARPDEIKVQLLRNGVVYQTVTLSESNRWQYTWTGLSSAYTWTLAEVTPSKYTVGIVQEGITFVLTNTYSADLPVEPPDEPNNPDNPDNPNNPNNPNNPSKPGTPGQPGSNGSGSTGDSKLPQTGQLWWPVPFLLAGGLLMIAFGLFRSKGIENEK